jgi:serine/threonine protein kinase
MQPSQANILVNDIGKAVICDLGLAKFMEEEYHTRLTTGPELFGTLCYLSLQLCDPPFKTGVQRSLQSNI